MLTKPMKLLWQRTQMPKSTKAEFGKRQRKVEEVITAKGVMEDAMKDLEAVHVQSLKEKEDEGKETRQKQVMDQARVDADVEDEDYQRDLIKHISRQRDLEKDLVEVLPRERKENNCGDQERKDQKDHSLAHVDMLTIKLEKKRAGKESLMLQRTQE